jgi:hypothetical protein
MELVNYLRLDSYFHLVVEVVDLEMPVLQTK